VNKITETSIPASVVLRTLPYLSTAVLVPNIDRTATYIDYSIITCVTLIIIDSV